MRLWSLSPSFLLKILPWSMLSLFSLKIPQKMVSFL
ncbi:hypothetical protein OIU74_019500 [Salix koriyanagi]|uniref:Uncharacterized protein n=1 Tax=Salix koriyanagi TaxID=2511006 RepID=A0A9Q0SL34_9ROSI|nr:hypothetical protein OIU74_019500 [Salix koriyanagi]